MSENENKEDGLIDIGPVGMMLLKNLQKIQEVLVKERSEYNAEITKLEDQLRIAREGLEKIILADGCATSHGESMFCEMVDIAKEALSKMDSL